MQINFGVVMNESMGDEVKITVIATGFERPSLPEFERRSALPASRPAPAPKPAPLPPPEPEPAEEAAFAPPEPAVPEPLPGPPPVLEPAETPSLFEEIDTPAFLRRDRKLFQ
ncbi:MAG: hypothetical protein HY822_08760 [Acidobacteria bacterium]|nr:hypothetical protein [Acidobacteriota bacterium]